MHLLSPFAHGNFPTPSGKAEFYSETLKRQASIRLSISLRRRNRATDQAPAVFRSNFSPASRTIILNSTFANLDSVREMEPWIGMLEMHPTDATARGIRDGDQVRAFNARGEIVLQARVDGAVPPEW